MIVEMADLLFDGIDQKKLMLVKKVKKLRHLAIKHTEKNKDHERHFKQLLVIEDKIMGEIERKYGV